VVILKKYHDRMRVPRLFYCGQIFFLKTGFMLLFRVFRLPPQPDITTSLNQPRGFQYVADKSIQASPKDR
jgi:hypothetical protein